MKKLVDLNILKGCLKILKNYFIIQEFTSVNKITPYEKRVYNEIAKIVEDNKND